MTTPRVSPWRDPALVSLVLIQIVVGSGFALLVPILPRYVELLGGGATELGLFNASYALMLFVCAPVWGWLSDRTGRRSALLAGTLGMGLSYLGLAVAPNLVIAIGLRALGGAFAAATVPASFAYVADTYSVEERGRAMGMISGGLGIAFVFSPVLGGTLATFSLIVPFVAAATTALAGSALVALFLRPGPPHTHKVATSTVEPVGRWEGFAVLLPMLTVSFIVAIADGTRQTALPLFADDQLTMGPPELGMVFSVMGACFVLSNWLLVGPAIRLLGERNAVIAGMPISMVGFLLVFMAHDTATLSAAIGVQGIGMAFGFTGVPAYLSRIARGGQGLAMGWRQTTVSGGQILGPLLGGLLYSMAPLLPFTAGAGLFLLAMVVAILKVRPARDRVVTGLTTAAGQ